jgi:hypothetical protein
MATTLIRSCCGRGAVNYTPSIPAPRSGCWYPPYTVGAAPCRPPENAMPCASDDPNYDGVIYIGPCPPPPPRPAPDCCHPPTGCWPICCPSSYGFVSQTGSLTTSLPNRCIPFSGISQTSGDVYFDGSNLILTQPGQYMASYVVNIPTGSTVNTVFSLNLDGQNLPGSVVGVSKPNAADTRTVTAQAFFTAQPGSMLCLMSSSPLSLSGQGAADTLASLSVMKLN